MMKADVLNELPVIKICTNYQLEKTVMDAYPFESGNGNFKMVYRKMKGWKESLAQCSSIQDIPTGLAAYIKFIENSVGLPIDIVSIGPDRLQTLQR